MDKRFLSVLFCFIFLLSLLFGILINSAGVFSVECSVNQCLVVSSDTCISVGTIVNLSGTKFYCDVDSDLKAQKNIKESCFEDYECVNYKCVEGLCQGRFISINQSIVQGIWDYIQGIIIPPPGPDDGGGGGSGCTSNSDCAAGYYCNSNHKCVLLCTSNWSCTSWSNIEGKCGTRTCTDTKHCSVPTGKPSESRSCDGIIYDDFYCGDGICNGDEVCESCPEDCADSCGGGILPPNLRWLWIVLIILLLIMIGVVVFFLVYRLIEDSKKKKKKTTKKDDSKTPSSTSKALSNTIASKIPPSIQKPIQTIQNMAGQMKNPASVFPVVPFNNQRVGVNTGLANRQRSRFPVR